MLFAKSIIEKDGMIEQMVKNQLEGKAHLVEELRNRGYEVNDQEGNFVFIKTKTDAKTVMTRLKEEKMILVKTYSGIGHMGECLRVSTGESYLMDRFINALLEVDGDE